MMVVVNARMQTQHLQKAKIQGGIDKKASKEYTRRQQTKHYDYTAYNVIGPDPENWIQYCITFGWKCYIFCDVVENAYRFNLNLVDATEYLLLTLKVVEPNNHP
jgi:hypothetical protein